MPALSWEIPGGLGGHTWGGEDLPGRQFLTRAQKAAGGDYIDGWIGPGGTWVHIPACPETDWVGLGLFTVSLSQPNPPHRIVASLKNRAIDATQRAPLKTGRIHLLNNFLKLDSC